MPLDAATIALAGAAAMGAVGVAVAAAVLLARAAETRDLGARIADVLRGAAPRARSAPGMALGSSLMRPLIRVGELMRDSALISRKDLAGFQRVMTAAGLNPARAVPVFLGAKALLLLVLPLSGLGAIMVMDLDVAQGGMTLAAALILVVMGPNWVVSLVRRPFQDNLRKGLPDALDLMVVAAEAGIGLESAVDRVAREMVSSNRAIALEFNILAQELRLLPDRRMALAQALRTLAAEMRQDRQLRLEEKAVRLPALLIGPLILFILPALFIALIGPSILEIGSTFGGSP